MASRARSGALSTGPDCVAIGDSGHPADAELTARERVVLGPVAEGTLQQGHRGMLFVTERTAEVHGKHDVRVPCLGVFGRREFSAS